MAVQRRKMLADHVYDELLEALIDGRYAAGAPLNIDELARELDVSQTPIREALVRLEATGLVRRAALRGYRVAPLLTRAEWTALTEARLVLEPANSYLACQRADEALVAGLEERLDRMRNAPDGPTFQEFRDFWQADEEFHQLIARHSGNAFLLRAFDSLGGQVQRFRMFGGQGVTDSRSAIEEHEAILAAFHAADPDAARDAMTQHITGVRERVLAESTEDDDAAAAEVAGAH